MGLSSDLISQFVKATKDTTERKSETTSYGTIVERDDSVYVQLDGSELLTPISTTADVKDGERVTVMIKNHTAIVTGNITSPSARNGDVLELGAGMDEVIITVNEASKNANKALDTVGDASKTATNFISITDDEGVQIGDQSTGSWSGFRAQITNAAFNILDTAGNKLASYGAKIVELGKNATDAVIKLCGGKGQIEYVTDDDTGDEYLQVNSNKLRLKSDGMSSLYSTYTDNTSRWEKSAVNVSPVKINMYASKCIDPSLPDMIEGWNTSDVTVNPDSINVSTPGAVNIDAAEVRNSHGEYLSVEVGTSGIWSYRKLQNGDVELWGSYPVSNIECASALGGMYRTDYFNPDAFPFEIYNPNLVASYESDGYGAMLWATATTTTTKPPSYYLVRPTSATIVSGKINFHVRGKWTT